jgi:protein TonB
MAMGVFNPAISAAGSGVRSVGPSASSFGIVAAAHAAAIVLLATFVPAERLIELARPLAVRLIEQAPEVPPPPKPEPPKPQPRQKVPLAPPPILAVATPTPAASPVEFVVAPQPPAPPVAAPVAPVVAAPPAPPAPITQARFDADYLKNPKPAYPSSSRRLGEEGKVVLRVHVTPEGLPAVVEVKASSNFPRLDHAAREAVSQWRFVPARRGEEAIAAWVLVPIVFSLES